KFPESKLLRHPAVGSGAPSNAKRRSTSRHGTISTSSSGNWRSGFRFDSVYLRNQFRAVRERTMTVENADERYVRERLHRTYGVLLRKIAETDEKTPDYELLVDEVRIAVVEVKCFERMPRTIENGWHATDGGFMTR